MHFSSSDLQATLPADYTFTPDDHGVHTFQALLKTAGTQSLTATDTVAANFSGTQADIVVHPAAAVTLSVSGYPVSATAGVGAHVLVQALDAYGNVDTNYTGTVHLTSNDPQAYLDPDHTFSAADAGQYSFYVVLNTAGTSWIIATDTATPSISGVEDGIIVNLP